MYSFYFDDPKKDIIQKEINNVRIQYFYFDNDLIITSKKNEMLNGCLLSGSSVLTYNGASYNFNKFDFFFLPPDSEVKIIGDSNSDTNLKICLYYSPIEGNINADFEIQHYNMEKFIPRGEFGSEKKMATYRTVWTAIKNGYFMSGFTNIPNEALKQGVVTSVNLEETKKGNIEIHPHIHPEYPEVYIFCIDDDAYAVTQYLVNSEGKSVCKDLMNGEGVFFPGYLGHINFAKPTYKKMNYCLYMWIISTFGKTDNVNPITLDV